MIVLGGLRLATVIKEALGSWTAEQVQELFLNWFKNQRRLKSNKMTLIITSNNKYSLLQI